MYHFKKELLPNMRNNGIYSCPNWKASVLISVLKSHKWDLEIQAPNYIPMSTVSRKKQTHKIINHYVFWTLIRCYLQRFNLHYLSKILLYTTQTLKKLNSQTTLLKILCCVEPTFGVAVSVTIRWSNLPLAFGLPFEPYSSNIWNELSQSYSYRYSSTKS